MKGGNRRMVWSGWGTQVQAIDAVRAAAADGLPATTSCEVRWDIRTFGDMASAWIIEQENRVMPGKGGITDGTHANYKACVKKIADPVFGLADVLPERVTKRVLEDYRDARLRSGASPRRVNLEMKIIRWAWDWGRDRGYVRSTEPLPSIRATVSARKFSNCHYTPRDCEVRDVLDDLAQRDHEVWFAVWLLFSTGARVGEVVDLRRLDIDRRTRELILGVGCRHGGKTGGRRFPLPGLPPLPDNLLNELEDRADGSALPLLGLARDGRQQLQGFLSRACRRTGVPRFTPHGLRRAFVDRALDLGMEPGTVAALTGHTPQVMYQHYRSHNPGLTTMRDALQQASRRYSSRPGEVIEGPWGQTETAKTGT